MRPLINVGSSGREAALGEGDGKILGQTDFDMHLGHPSEYSHWEVAYEAKIQETGVSEVFHVYFMFPYYY